MRAWNLFSILQFRLYQQRFTLRYGYKLRFLNKITSFLKLSGLLKHV